MKEQEFDIILVGAGPSAAGLLYGLLSRIIISDNRGGDGSDDVSSCKGKKKSNNNLSHLRIAILERGKSSTLDMMTNNNKACCSSAADDDDDDDMISTTSLFEHCHPATHSLQNWFQTAHYIPPPLLFASETTTKRQQQHPTILHATIPQSNLSNRIIDVPTGSGWGGGTNINAGLVMSPHYYFEKNDFVDNSNNNWPGSWKGSDGLIQNSLEEILTVMKTHGGLTTKTSTCSFCCNGDLQSEAAGCGVTSPLFLDAKDDDNGNCSGEENDDDGYFISKFHQPTLSSTVENKRVNYFTSLIAPLLERHPELHSNVVFLSGVQVERILIRYSCDAGGNDDNENDDNVSKQTQHHQCKPQAWAVECNHGEHQGIIIRSKRDIILCSGAIATPSLLLASGIGTEDDLRTAGIAPWYEGIRCNIHDAAAADNNNPHDIVKKDIYRNLPVGHNLRDHIVLPRMFLTPRLYSFGAASCNSINGWWMIHVPTSCSAKMQLQFADGIQMDYMIPHFAAGALRRRWVLPFPAVPLPLAWIQRIFLGVRAVLRAFFGSIPVLSKWVKLHTTFLNLCLLNPKSVGRVTVSRSSRRTKSHHARLSDCKVIIDPNYLSDSWDVESLWRGWTSSSRVKQRWFKRGIEILPGYAFSIGCAACSLISSAIHWVSRALLGGKLHDKNEPQEGGKVPQWFRKYAAEFSNPYYHWCGTCAMGGEEDSTSGATQIGSVVDEHLCVRGLSNLRICDASVFPDCVSAPPALTCAALGHAASSFIIA